MLVLFSTGFHPGGLVRQYKNTVYLLTGKHLAGKFQKKDPDKFSFIRVNPKKPNENNSLNALCAGFEPGKQ